MVSGLVSGPFLDFVGFRVGFRAAFESLRVHIGDHFEITFGNLCDRFGIALGSLWDISLRSRLEISLRSGNCYGK